MRSPDTQQQWVGGPRHLALLTLQTNGLVALSVDPKTDQRKLAQLLRECADALWLENELKQCKSETGQ